MYTGLEERRAAADRAQEEALRVALLAKSNQMALIEGARQLITALTQLPEIQDSDPQMCSAFLSELLPLYPDYADLGLVTPDGNLICHSGFFDAGLNIADRPYFVDGLRTGEFVTGDFVISRIDGNIILPFVHPILDKNGEVQAVVLATQKLNWLEGVGSQANIPDEAVFLVLDHQGQILSRYPQTGDWIGESFPDMAAVRSAVDASGNGVAVLTGEDGIQRLYAFSFLDIGRNGAYISYGIPTELAYRSVNRNLLTNLATLSLITLVSLLAAWLIADYTILRKVHALVAATQRLAEGDLGARTGLTPSDVFAAGELSQLARSFDQMAAALQERDTKLRQAEAQYRMLVEQIPAITYVVSLENPTETLYISPQVENILGYAPQEWMSQKGIWGSHLHPDDRFRVLDEYHKMVNEGIPYRLEYRLYNRHGEIRWIQDAGNIVKDSTGTALFLQGIMVDITELKQTEAALKKYAVELERSNRELQDFAYIASHDLQEPLRKIQAFGERLQIKYGSSIDPGGRDYIERMCSSANRMQTLINDLLSYSRITTRANPFAQVDLNKVMRDVQEELEHQISRTNGWVEVGNLPVIEADRTQMQQLFRNLISNALKFNRPGVPPHVKVFIDENPETPEGNSTVSIYVSDNGIGFDEKYLDRIFLPFQRLHGHTVYDGSGIGLAISRKIVERHNGRITARSTPGVGSTFIITLPIHPSGHENGDTNEH
jgi:PAS domain S-box-containing protein